MACLDGHVYHEAAWIGMFGQGDAWLALLAMMCLDWHAAMVMPGLVSFAVVAWISMFAMGMPGLALLVLECLVWHIW